MYVQFITWRARGCRDEVALFWRARKYRWSSNIWFTWEINGVRKRKKEWKYEICCVFWFINHVISVSYYNIIIIAGPTSLWRTCCFEKIKGYESRHRKKIPEGKINIVMSFFFPIIILFLTCLPSGMSCNCKIFTYTSSCPVSDWHDRDGTIADMNKAHCQLPTFSTITKLFTSFPCH